MDYLSGKAYTGITFHDFDIQFLELSWIWLNDPEIRYSIDSSEFTKLQQWDWFESLSKKKNYLIWGIKFNCVPIGACGLKNITATECEYWGYIGLKEFQGRGLGNLILREVEKRAQNLGLKKVWLKVLKDNQRAISLYVKNGFFMEIESDKFYFLKKEI